jgi:predicted transcriptional regulator
VPDLTRNQRRTLIALKRGPLYRGAIPLVLGGKVAAPGSQLRQLEGLGLVSRGRSHWELTDAGRVAADKARD